VIALSPVLSWFLVLVVLFVAVLVYAAVVAGGRADEMAERAWASRQATLQSAREAQVRIFGGIYDHEARGDLHNPIRDHEWCDDCNARLRRAFNQVADLDLGPRDADALMASIQKALES